MSHEPIFHTVETALDNLFWKENFPKLQRYCHFLTQSKWDGDDVAQETYLKALKYSAHQQNITSALVKEIAYHHWIDMLRKRKNESIEEVSTLEGEGVEKNSVDELANTVELLLNQLTPKQAVIFLLKEGFLFKVKEIAAVLDTTEMAVKANLHRAKNRLDKAREGKAPFSVENFWEEEEREELAELFYESLKIQDPAVLIRSIPLFKSISGAPGAAENKIMQKKTFTPSSTLCMAA